MELKRAAAVCLIALFASTLVVLVARSLDSQAAARLEPQLTAIVDELRALRKQGGLAPSADDAGSDVAAATAEPLADGLVVYYFHSDERCATCRSIESQAKEALFAEHAPRLARGEIAWRVVNYQRKANAALAQRFDIQVPVVVLARSKGGEIVAWRRLDEVWGLVDDKPAYAKYLREQLAAMLEPGTEGEKPAPAIPVPE